MSEDCDHSAYLRFGIESSEAGMELHVYYPRDVDYLFAEAAAGNERAAIILQAGYDLIRKTKAVPKRKRPICLCCPKPIGNALGAVVFLIPATLSPSQSIGMLICAHCVEGYDRAALSDKAKTSLLRLWPHLREMPAPTHPDGGRA
jgi:hypothetical protein